MEWTAKSREAGWAQSLISYPSLIVPLLRTRLDSEGGYTSSKGARLTARSSHRRRLAVHHLRAECLVSPSDRALPAHFNLRRNDVSKRFPERGTCRSCSQLPGARSRSRPIGLALAEGVAKMWPPSHSALQAATPFDNCGLFRGIFLGASSHLVRSNLEERHLYKLHHQKHYQYPSDRRTYGPSSPLKRFLAILST